MAMSPAARPPGAAAPGARRLRLGSPEPVPASRWRRGWAGEVRNVSLLVAIGVNAERYREVFGIVKGAKEDYWSAFLKHRKDRALKCVT